ncbi:MAG TPA: hypothetical protein DHV36_18605 [Desulfobacteraceae bacterium]|nr:hypothetical protein [Desulfobacteraceae bacterium]
MEVVRAVLKLLLVMGLFSTAWAGGNPDDLLPQPSSKPVPEPAVTQPTDPPASSQTELPRQPDSFSGTPDWIYRASDWELNLYITQKGTRSQGSHGILIFEGINVVGTPGEVRALPIGTVQYNGPAESRVNLWDDTGWQMIDALVKPIVNEPVAPVDFGAGKNSDSPALLNDKNTDASDNFQVE